MHTNIRQNIWLARLAIEIRCKNTVVDGLVHLRAFARGSWYCLYIIAGPQPALKLLCGIIEGGSDGIL